MSRIPLHKAERGLQLGLTRGLGSSHCMRRSHSQWPGAGKGSLQAAKVSEQGSNLIGWAIRSWTKDPEPGDPKTITEALMGVGCTGEKVRGKPC